MNIQQIENDDYEANAPYDYVREAYAGLCESPAALAYEMEECAREWEAEQAAFIGPRLPAPVYDNDTIPF